MALAVGNKFDSYEELDHAVKKFEIENSVNLYKKECKKIEAVKKKCPNRVFKQELIYASIVYACVRNGKYRPRQTTGERPNQSTFRSGCEFAIKIRSLEGEFLTITHHGPAHNHECGTDEFRHYPAQRRLGPQQAATVRQMVQLDANKKLIKANAEEATRKVVLMKDIHNLARKRQPAAAHHNSELEELAAFMSDCLPNVSMEVTHVDENVSGIFLQDKLMQETFAKYPEVLFVDATYKVNHHNMPLYSVVVVDGNMESHPVCFFMVVREDESSVRNMLQIFKVSADVGNKSCSVVNSIQIF